MTHLKIPVHKIPTLCLDCLTVIFWWVHVNYMPTIEPHCVWRIIWLRWLHRYPSWMMCTHHTVPIRCLQSRFWTWKSKMHRSKTSSNVVSSRHSVATLISGISWVTTNSDTLSFAWCHCYKVHGIVSSVDLHLEVLEAWKCGLIRKLPADSQSQHIPCDS